MYACIAYIGHVKPEDTIDFHVRFAWASIARQYGQLAAERGSTMAMGQTLLNIERNGTPSTQLGPRMGMERTSLSRLLNSLESRGMIERKADDGRPPRRLRALDRRRQKRARPRPHRRPEFQRLGGRTTGRSPHRTPARRPCRQLNDLIVQYPTRDALPGISQDDNTDSNAA